MIKYGFSFALYLSVLTTKDCSWKFERINIGRLPSYFRIWYVYFCIWKSLNLRNSNWVRKIRENNYFLSRTKLQVQWNLSTANTISSQKRCPLQKGVRYEGMHLLWGVQYLKLQSEVNIMLLVVFQLLKRKL